jgi:hypothetical protein
MIDFAAGRHMAIRSIYFMHKKIHLKTCHSPDGRTFNKIDLIDGRHFSDVKAQRGANIDSDHILVVITFRAKICRAYTTREDQQRRRFAVEKLKSEEEATQYRNELESEFQSAHDVQTRSLNVLWYATEEKIKKPLPPWTKVFIPTFAAFTTSARLGITDYFFY